MKRAIVDDLEDPIVRSAFWHIFGAASVLAGNYRETIRVVDRALSEIERSGIEFARPHVLVNRAIANIGLGLTAEAEAALNSVEKSARKRQDVYLMTNARVFRCRLLLEQGASKDALKLTSQPWGRSHSRCMRAECLAVQAAALMADGQIKKASRLARDARALSRYLEPQFLARWISLVCKMTTAKTVESVADTV